MDDGPLGGVFDSAAQDFVGQWGGIPFAQEDKPQQVDDRINVSPMEVDLGNASSRFFQLNEESCDGIGNGRACGTEHTIGTFAASLNGNRFGEFGGVSALHLNEVDEFIVCEPVKFAQVLLACSRSLEE